MSANHSSTVEVADIFREHIGDSEKSTGCRRKHCEVVSDIIGCRTEWMGGHIQRCDSCGEEIALYNSCRNRHCPQMPVHDEGKMAGKTQKRGPSGQIFPQRLHRPARGEPCVCVQQEDDDKHPVPLRFRKRFSRSVPTRPTVSAEKSEP